MANNFRGYFLPHTVRCGQAAVLFCTAVLITNVSRVRVTLSMHYIPSGKITLLKVGLMTDSCSPVTSLCADCCVC